MSTNRLELLLTASTQQLEAGMARASTAVEGLSDDAKSLKGSLEGAGDAVSEIADVNKWQAVAQGGQFVSDVAGRVGALASKFLESGKQLDDLKDRIGTFTDAGKVDSVAQDIRDLAAATGQSEAALVSAAQKMGTFGQYSSDNLQRIVDMAAKTGKSVEQATQAFVLLGAGGPAASEAVNQLAKDFGISADEMAAAGALLDKNNKVLADTPQAAAAAQKALQTIIDSNFAGAAAEQQDSLDEMHVRLEQLNQDIGEHTLNAYNAAADAALPFLDILKEMPGWMKQVIGVGTGVVGSLGGIAGTGLQAAANLKMLGFTASGAGAAMAKAGVMGRAAMTAILGPLGLAITAVALLAAGFQAYINELERANAAAENLLDTEERRAAALRKHADYIGKSADELHRMGVKSQELVDVIGGLQDQREAAAAAGNDEQVKKIESQIVAIQKAKTRLAEMEAAARAAKAAKDALAKTPAATKADTKAVEDLKKATDDLAKSTQSVATARTEAASTPAPSAPAAKQQEASKKQTETAEKVHGIFVDGVRIQNDASEKQVEAAKTAAAETVRAAEATTNAAAQQAGSTLNPILGGIQDFVESQKGFAVQSQAVGAAVQANAAANTGLRSAMGGGGSSGGGMDLSRVESLLSQILGAIQSLKSSGGSSFGRGLSDASYFSSGSQ